jgi:predicted phosphodiesterase
MKLGLIADIHEDVDALRLALDRFRTLRVDQVVCLGDVVAMNDRLAETCRLLADTGVVGVWGNHDFGLCQDVDPTLAAEYPAEVVTYMASLRPRLEIEGCHFCHVEPWLDPTELSDLWYFEGPPDEHGKLDRIFAATTCRLIFAGHYHKWLLATPAGFFVVIGALCEGRYALFDTDTSELTPFNDALQ